MAYGLRYTSDFDALSITPLYFTINIYEDGYTDAPQTITMGPNPAIQEWQDDEAKKPIKGCTLTLEIINNGDIKLDDFYSENDNQFRVEMIWNSTSEVLFVGNVLQDDCSELMVDYAHIITIVATDNLGLLKDVTLSQAARSQGPITTKTGILIEASAFITNQFFTSDIRMAQFRPGDTFTIETGAFAGTYFLLSIGYNNITFEYTLTVGSQIPFSAPYSADISWNDDVPLNGYISLLELVRLCIKSTNVSLGVRVMAEVFPVGGSTERWLDDTYVFAQTFYEDNKWLDCYNVLEQILSRFYASCFQAKGFWYIVRWNELYKIQSNSYNMFGYAYDSDFVYQVDYVEDPRIDLTFEAGRPVETGIIKSIERPFKYVEETFNYRQPNDLLRNGNMNELGALINEYTGGTNTIREYELLHWFNWDASPGPYPNRYIRITNDTATGDEIDRYIVVEGNTFDSARSVQSTAIEVSENDFLIYSFDYRTDVSQPGSVNNVFAVRINDVSNLEYVDNNGEWVGTIGFVYNVPAGDNTNQWHTVEITTRPIPYNGLLSIFLAECTSNSLDETHYKNFRLEIRNSITGLSTVVGHTHTATQPGEIKNRSEKEIFIDNSPKSTIAGTLYLSTTTNVNRDKCTDWKYKSQGDIFNRLGELMTFEELYSRYNPKYKYQMTLRFITEGSFIFSNFLAAWSSNAAFNNSNLMVPGTVVIDYKNNAAQFSFYEIAYNEEAPNDSFRLFQDFYVSRLYEFNYLYENR